MTMTTQLLKPKKKRTTKNGSNGGNHRVRVADIVINGSVHIPPWVTDHDSFRRWAFSDSFPERGRFAFLAGKLWVDLSMENIVHNQIKTIITVVLGSIVVNESLGMFLVDGMLLTQRLIGMSNEPDAMFVSNASLASGVAALKKGDKSMELTGAADMALEVVSKSSVDKDMGDLMSLYAKAGIAEYWIVDSTVEMPELEIYRLVSGKYGAARKHDGWVKSNVFSRSFRLTSKKDAQGLSQFNLETK
jgi:Uma2 family endonuclease